MRLRTYAQHMSIVITTTKKKKKKKKNPRKTLAPSSSEKIKTIPISVRLEDLTTFNRNSIRPIQTTFGATSFKKQKNFQSKSEERKPKKKKILIHIT